MHCSGPVPSRQQIKMEVCGGGVFRAATGHYGESEMTIFVSYYFNTRESGALSAEVLVRLRLTLGFVDVGFGRRLGTESSEPRGLNAGFTAATRSLSPNQLR
uniref:Uncharacterized protein n=1 Tax=Knipowitschia caucasica TaxID=637954 RepID=A0AAV2LEV4_KNICA